MIRLVIALIDFAIFAVPLHLVAAVLSWLLGPLARLIELVEPLVMLVLRLGAGAVAALVGGTIAVAIVSQDQAWCAVPVALAAAGGTLWLTRGWGRARVPARIVAPEAALRCDPAQAPAGLPAERGSGRRARGPDLERPADPAATARHPASAPPAPATVPTTTFAVPPDARQLVPDALRQRLVATEEALTRAARDNLGAPAADWLEFWRRRVPDLIAAGEDVHADADPAEKEKIAKRLAEHLAGIIAEADRRLAIVRDARRDLFTTRGNHADGRIREG